MLHLFLSSSLLQASILANIGLFYCLHNFAFSIQLESYNMQSFQTSYFHLVVQSPNHVWLSVSPWTTARRASLYFTISQSLLKLMSIELVMPSKHLVLCHPLLLLPSILPSSRVFSSELALCIRWPKCWSFSISPSSAYSGFISFRVDWFDIAVQGVLKSSPASQFESISSLTLRLYGPALTSVHEY